MARKKKDPIREEQERWEKEQQVATMEKTLADGLDFDDPDPLQAEDVADLGVSQDQYDTATATEDPTEPKVTIVKDEDDVHVERASRTIRRPFTKEEHDQWENQHVRATLTMRSLRGDKKAVMSDFNARIQIQRDEAECAAEKLKEKSSIRYVPCEIVWDYPNRMYREIADDTREITVERPMSLEEIERFRQRKIPGMQAPGGPWLKNEKQGKAEPEDGDPDDRDLQDDPGPDPDEDE